MTTTIDRPTLTELPSTIHVEVTHEDIAAGSPGDMSHCPIALALRRTVPGLADVEIDAYARLETHNDFRSYDLPEEARYFIQAFDDEDGYVVPFAFDMSWMEGE